MDGQCGPGSRHPAVADQRIGFCPLPLGTQGSPGAGCRQNSADRAGHFSGDAEAMVKALERALYCAKIISYTQGFSLMREASRQHGWDLDLALIARIWRGGCIIRSAFLDKIAAAYDRIPDLENLLFDDYFTATSQRCPGRSAA